MKYKSPKQHNNVVQTMLEEAIKKIIKTKHYESDVNMLTNVLDYHQQINDKEIKRRFYEDFVEMQQELPVIHVDSDLLSIIAKHVTQYGFALTHGPDGEYMSTALLHKAGYKVSTKLKNGLNAKRTNVINMLSLAIQDENLTEVEEDVDAYNEDAYNEDACNEETPNLATQFMSALKFAIENGDGINHMFGTPLVTLEDAYKEMIEEQEYSSGEWDACMSAYEDAFYEYLFINAISSAVKNKQGIHYKFGKDQHPIENLYKNMVEMQENGSVKWDKCIIAYSEAFINNKGQ